eukprot:15455249-Alexandrium_andersonii.AAC.1
MSDVIYGYMLTLGGALCEPQRGAPDMFCVVDAQGGVEAYPRARAGILFVAHVDCGLPGPPCAMQSLTGLVFGPAGGGRRLLGRISSSTSSVMLGTSRPYLASYTCASRHFAP